MQISSALSLFLKGNARFVLKSASKKYLRAEKYLKSYAKKDSTSGTNYKNVTLCSAT